VLALDAVDDSPANMGAPMCSAFDRYRRLKVTVYSTSAEFDQIAQPAERFLKKCERLRPKILSQIRGNWTTFAVCG
jgi:hypothetical protein